MTIIHRRDEFRASKIMADRALANDKIKVAWNSVVTEVLGDDGKVVGVRLRDTVSGDERVLDVVRRVRRDRPRPAQRTVRRPGDMDAEGYVTVDAPSTRTNIAGVFAAGDLVDHTYRQAITAAGTGCAAALDAERYLASARSLSPHRPPTRFDQKEITWEPRRPSPTRRSSTRC